MCNGHQDSSRTCWIYSIWNNRYLHQCLVYEMFCSFRQWNLSCTSLYFQKEWMTTGVFVLSYAEEQMYFWFVLTSEDLVLSVVLNTRYIIDKNTCLFFFFILVCMTWYCHVILQWSSEIAQEFPDVPFLLIGCKNDLRTDSAMFSTATKEMMEDADSVPRAKVRQYLLSPSLLG